MVIALPKGRIAQEVLSLFSQLWGEELQFPGRKLVLERNGFKFLNVRNWDVPIYVEQGVADLGVVGLDVVEELGSEVFRLLDLGLGRCRVSIAGPVGVEYRELFRQKGELKIATKLVNLTRRYFEQEGVPVEIIKLNGSVELAPLVGLSDFIVDIVETGATLKSNGLEEKESILHSSVQLIGNPTSFWVNRREIGEVVTAIERALQRKRGGD
jgi:ATP phosphoribosyltransferase